MRLDLRMVGLDTEGGGHRESQPQRHGDTENRCVFCSLWLLAPVGLVLDLGNSQRRIRIAEL
jgi:hypothetical protein